MILFDTKTQSAFRTKGKWRPKSEGVKLARIEGKDKSARLSLF